MLTGIGNVFRGLLGGATPRGGPLPPAPQTQLAFRTPGEVGLARDLGLTGDRIVSDVWNGPWRGPLELDDDGDEDPRMRREYREAFRKNSAVRAAVRGKVNAVASLGLAVAPADRNPASKQVAAFVKDALDDSEHGSHGLLRNIIQSAVLDGYSVCETTLEPCGPDHPLGPKYPGKWALRHCRQVDTLHLRLRLDQFRNVLGVVNLRRGVELYPTEKTLIFTYSGMYSNPFGQSDLRACYREIGLIEDAYKAWYVAIKRFSLPYVHGKYSTATNKAALKSSIQELYNGGFIVTDKDTEVELLDLAAASSFQAFEAKVNKMREAIFLAIRGAYLPFLEGQGGENAHADTEVHKDAVTADDRLLAKDVAQVINRQLIPVLVRQNYGPNQPCPRVVIAGHDTEQAKAQLEVGAMLLTQYKLPLSKEEAYETAQWSPPDGDDDIVVPPQDPGQQPGGMPGMPGAPGQQPGLPGQPPAAGGQPPPGPAAQPDAAGFSEADDDPEDAVVTVAAARLLTDPKRFQFRRGHDREDGTVRDLPAEPFDVRKCKPLLLWHDPADGGDYVVDGHHRLAWAERDGVKRLPGVFLRARTAAEARRIGEQANRRQAAAAKTFSEGAGPPDVGRGVDRFLAKHGLVA